MRSYIIFIEDRFGDDSPTAVSPKIKKLATQGKPFLKHIYQRVYRWWNYFIDKPKDMYIRTVHEAVDDFYKKKYPGENTVGDKYVQFLLEFFESLAIACDMVNKEIAHILSGQGTQLLITDYFDKAIDEKIVVFYNSLLGKDLKPPCKDILVQEPAE